MTLLDTLKADLLAARKQKNASLIATLSTFLGDLETNSKKTGKPIDDAQIVALAKSRIATNKEVAGKIAAFDGHAAKVLEAEISVYEKYLPAQLTEAQIRLSIELLLDEYTSPVTLDLVQGYFRTRYPGQYDGKLVTDVFKSMEAAA